MAAVLEVSDLRTEIRLREGVVRAVDGVSLSLEEGETLGLVGESGCGKTTTVLSIMNLLPPGGSITGGSVKLSGREICHLPERDMRKIRGSEIAMIFQDPLTSLNPTMTIGNQIAEAFAAHRDVSREEAEARAVEVLDLVGLPKAKDRVKDYPHHFSGGMRQRVMIAIALACEPKVLIADEPTTALDVTIQKQILELIDDLRRRLGMAVILVTHDLGVIAGRTDRVAVMYAGRIAESTDTEALFSRPGHPYTEALFQALPDKVAEQHDMLYSIPGQPPNLVSPPQGCRFAARCRYAIDRCRVEEPDLSAVVTGHELRCFFPLSTAAQARRMGEISESPSSVSAWAATGEELLKVSGLVKEYPVTRGAVLQRHIGSVSAVSGVSFSINQGETFGLVGESGCGKSTVGRLVVGLDRPSDGKILFQGEDLTAKNGRGYRTERRNIQLMFQDSYASLDPRMRAGALLREPLVIHRIGSQREQGKRVEEMLFKVGLPRSAADRYPHEFSGGQRQRLGFARALMLSPRLIVADEPVSALDVSIRAQVLNMMKELQRDLGLTYLFISHDLGVVRYLSDRIGVMYLGKMVEIGPAEEIYLRPAHPYTRGLLDSAPVADPEVEKAKGSGGVTGELPSALRPPSGCRFRTRCPRARAVCAEAEPVPVAFAGDGHVAACHFPLERAVGTPAVSGDTTASSQTPAL